MAKRRRVSSDAVALSINPLSTPSGASVVGPIEPVPPVVTINEEGISGTTNWWGDPQVESNSSLIQSQAFGVAGTRTWGEWQRIAMTDPDVAAVLDFIVSPIRDAIVSVEPYENHPDQGLAEAQAEFVRWNILENVAPRWPELLDQMARGPLTYGFSIHEVVLGLGEHETLPNGSGFVLRKLAERLPVSVHPVNGWRECVDPVDQSRELEAIQQIGQYGKTFRSDIILPAWKVLLNTWKRSGNNYRGIPFTRPVWYWCRVREQLAKLVGISMVREAAGLPVASAMGPDSPDLSKTARQKLEKLLANMVIHENASVVMPKGWKLEWNVSSGRDKNHVMEVYTIIGQHILRLLGAQQIALGASSGSGSRAVGQVHSDTAQSYIQGVVSMLEGTLNGVGDRKYTGLARKIVEPNWGPQPGYPRIVITLKRAQLGAMEKAQAAKTLVDAGALTITHRDENTLRDELGLEPIEESERDAEIEKAKALLPPNPFDPSAPPTPPKGAATPAEKKAPGAFPKKQMSYAPSRALRPEERVLDLNAMDFFLTNARKDLERELRPEVVAMVTRAAPVIKEAIKAGTPEALATIHLDTGRVEKVVELFVERVRAEGQRNVKAELTKGKARRLAERRAKGDQSLAPVARFANEDLEDVNEQDVLDNIKRAMVRRLTGRVRTQLEQEAIDALRTDGDEADVVSRVMQDQLDTAAFRTDAGQTLTKVYNLGRDEAARMLGGVEKVQYSAILDGNQCSACEEMDGVEWDFNSAEHDANLPPNRDCDGGGNCRCVLVYVPAED